VRHIEDDQTNSGHRPDVVNDMLYQNKIISRKQYETNKKKGRSLTNYDLAKTLKSNNIQTIAYKNEFEDPGSTSYIITDPKQVRRLQLNLNTKINFDRYKGTATRRKKEMRNFVNIEESEREEESSLSCYALS
jgi:hypothetical protein